MRRLLLALLCAASLLPALARADGGPKVAVVPFAPLSGDVPVQAGSKSASLLASELGNLGTLTSVDLGIEADEAAGKALQAARDAVAAAQAAEKKRKLGAAATAYRAAIAAYDSAAALLDTPTELSDAHVALGTALYLTGEDEQGSQELASALSLTPARAFAGEATSPLFTATVSKVREQVLSAEKAWLRIDSTPPGARAFLDGQELGRTPISVRDIPAGKHLWRVSLPTSRPIGGAVVLAPGAKQSVAAILGGMAPASRLIAALAGNRLDERVLASAKAASGASGVDILVFGALLARGQELVLEPFLYSPARNAVTRLPRKTFDAEMLSAGVELFKLAGEIGGRVQELGVAEKIGGRISAEAAPFASAERTEKAYSSLSEKPAKAEERGGVRRPVDPNKNLKNLRPRDP